MKSGVMAIFFFLLDVAWIWIACWWGYHLSPEPWLSLAQTIMMVVISVVLLACTVVGFGIALEEDPPKQ